MIRFFCRVQHLFLTTYCHSDHETGLLLFRGYSLEEMWNSDFEDMLHLLVWGSYPTAIQKKELSRKLAGYMLDVPETVQKAIQSLP